MKHLLTLILILAIGNAFHSCGSKKASDLSAENAETVEVQKSQLAEALASGNLRHASAMADSMSLFVDDFTPEQTVQVLSAFVKVHLDAESKRETRRDLETMRKFVDVYDIALSVNPNDTRSAFAKARRNDPSLDFDSIAGAFREKLANYDSMQDGSLVGSREEKTDSAATKADTVAAPTPKKETPLEHRPAE